MAVMPRFPSTTVGSSRPRRWISAWKGVTQRPATGRSFVIVLVLASLAAVAVTIWTFYSVGKTPHGDGAAAAGFKI